MDVVEPTPDKPIILNLPATVECYTPNVYGDVIEWFGRTIRNRDSRRPQPAPAQRSRLRRGRRRVRRDGRRRSRRGDAVRQRRAHRQRRHRQLGDEPVQSTASTLSSTSATSTRCAASPSTATACRCHPRHPYVGDLVYTSFSGSHQDAIKKGFEALPQRDYDQWGVPYLPLDPKHVGRTYEAVIRVNSQSGKGGVAYMMKAEHGFELPRRCRSSSPRPSSTSRRTPAPRSARW